MKQIHTAVLERYGEFTADFATEPYEAGWAEEAIFFVKIAAVNGTSPKLTGAVQISPDGLTWIDEGTTLPDTAQPGLVFARVRHFGNWLRLSCRVSGDGANFQGMILLSLKG